MVGRDCTVAWLVEGNWMAALLDGRLDGALLVAREWNSWIEALMVGREWDGWMVALLLV